MGTVFEDRKAAALEAKNFCQKAERTRLRLHALIQDGVPRSDYVPYDETLAGRWLCDSS